MENKVSYVLVGLFVVIFTTSLVILGIWLSSVKGRKEYITYAVYMEEAVSGLSEQSIVKFNGVPVGFIYRIQLDPQNVKNVRILVSIEKEVPVTVSTTATLKAQGLTGLTYMELLANSDTIELLKAQYGQPYPVIPSKPSLLVQLDGALREVTTNLKRMGDGFSGVFDKDNVKSIKRSLSGIATISETIAGRSREIDHSLQNMNRLLRRTAKVSEDLPDVMKQLKKTLANANKMTTNMNLASIDAKDMFSEIKMTFSNLSTQIMPNLHQLLSNMSSVSLDIQEITEQMRYDPSVLIKGRKRTGQDD